MAQAVLIPSGAQTSVIKCKLCENSGEFFCKECPSALCKPCREKHDMLLGGHTVVNIKTIDRSAFTISCNSRCSSHLQPFKLYCNQCELLICYECVAEDHNGHNSSRIERIVEKLRESAGGNVSLIKERVGKLSEVLDKTKSEKLPKIEVDLQATSKNIDSTLRSINQTIDDRKDIKTTEYEDFKKLQDLDTKKELKRRENILSEYRNLLNSIEKMLAEDHAVTFYISYNNLKKDIDDFDEDMLKDIDLPNVPKFDSKSFAEEIVHAISAKFELRLSGHEDSEKDKQRIVQLMEENVTLQQNLRDLKTKLSSTSNTQQQEVHQLKEELSNIRSKDNLHVYELNQQKEGLTQKIRNLEKQAEDLHNRLSTKTFEHQQEIRQLKNEFSSKRSKDNAQMSELKEKQNEFREQKTRKLEEQVQDLNKRLSNNTDGHQQEIRRLNQEFSSTRIQDSAQISELKKQKEVLEQKTRKLEEDVQDLNKRHSNITEGHQQAISLLKEELSSTRLSDNAHTSEMKKVKEALEQKARKLEEQVQILNNRLSSKTDEHQQEIRQLNQDLGSIRTKANGNISVLRSQKEDLEQKTNTLQNEIQDLKNRLSSKTDEHQQEIRQLNQDLGSIRTKANGNISVLRSEKEDLEQKTNTLQNEVQDLKNRLSSITDSHQQEVNRLTQELNSSRMETNGQVSGLEREKETLEQRNNFLEQQVQSHEYRMSMQDSKISGNQRLIDDYKQQISKYQQQIECFQNPISYLFACTTCSNTIVTCVPRNSTPIPIYFGTCKCGMNTPHLFKGGF